MIRLRKPSGHKVGPMPANGMQCNSANNETGQLKNPSERVSERWQSDVRWLLLLQEQHDCGTAAKSVTIEIILKSFAKIFLF